MQIPMLVSLYSVTFKESYSTVEMVLQKLCYNEHKWLIYVDLKMVNLLLGQQGGYVKYPCFPCLWDSRADGQHWQRKDWPVREELVGGRTMWEMNRWLIVIESSSHLCISNWAWWNNSVKTLDKNGDCFWYIRNRFPATSYEKVKAGIFDGPQIRTLMKDSALVSYMTVVESAAWCSYVSVVKEF